MKKFRIVELDREVLKYRVDQRHWFLFIPYWDHGSSDLSPNYLFEKIEDAEKAILKNILSYNVQDTRKDKCMAKKVLVRNNDDENWILSVLRHKTHDGKYICIGNEEYKQCVIYCNETKNLYLTSQKCDNDYVL